MDTSGQRRRVLRWAALTVGFACSGYLVLFALVLGGLQQPADRQPPETGEPVPTEKTGRQGEVPASDPHERSSDDSSDDYDPVGSTGEAPTPSEDAGGG